MARKKITRKEAIVRQRAKRYQDSSVTETPKIFWKFSWDRNFESFLTQVADKMEITKTSMARYGVALFCLVHQDVCFEIIEKYINEFPHIKTALKELVNEACTGGDPSKISKAMRQNATNSQNTINQNPDY